MTEWLIRLLILNVGFVLGTWWGGSRWRRRIEDFQKAMDSWRKLKATEAQRKE